MTELLGVRKAAAKLELSASTVSRYVAKHPELNRARAGAARPLIDVEEYRAHAAGNVNQAMSGNHAGRLFGDGEEDDGADDTPGAANGVRAPTHAGVFSRAHGAKEAVLAQEARLRLDEKLGLLVPKREVEDAAFEAAQATQRAFLQLGLDLSDRLAAMDNPREIAALLEEEHRRVLTDLADALNVEEEADVAA